MNGSRRRVATASHVDSNVVSIDQAGYRVRWIERRDALFERHLNLARSIARSVFEHLPPSFDLSDLEQIGYIAMLDCATRYRPRAHDNTPFEVFARPRVRGAILDSVRRRHYSDATRPGLDAVPEPAAEPTVEESIDRERTRGALRKAIAYLPPAQRAVVRRRYDGSDATFEQIGVEMGMHRATVQKLHSVAIAALQRRGAQILRDVA